MSSPSHQTLAITPTESGPRSRTNAANGTQTFKFDIESSSIVPNETFSTDPSPIKPKKFPKTPPPISQGSSEPTYPTSITQKMIAEVMGTATLVFFGCGSVCAGTYTGALQGLGQIATVWVFGATLAIYISGSISGGHLNPAVSLAFALVRGPEEGLSWALLAPYWCAQLVGAFLGSAVMYGIFSTAIANYEKQNGIIRGNDSVAVGFGAYWSSDVSGPFQAFFIEVIGTAMLTFIIFCATHKKNGVPPAAVPAIIGTAIGTIIAIIGSLSGGAINPARDLGPRIMAASVGWGSDSFRGLGVYLLGPLVGGPLGAVISDYALWNKRFG